jgi:hypothetical protein
MAATVTSVENPGPFSLATPIFEAANPYFQVSFDEKPFEFTHSFTAAHPLFSLTTLRGLLNDPAVRSTAVYDATDVQIDQRWDSLPREKPPVEQVFDEIQTSGGWIMMRHMERLPAYNQLLQACLDEVKKLSGHSIDGDKKSQEAIIFVTSPNRKTPYHIDRECNFLMQVSGEKTISVFDRNDREVTPEHEIETFWSRDNNAGVYKPQLQDRAFVCTMRPGTGVHIPVNSPHWLQNCDNVSISLSISYQYKDWRRKNVYQANYYLRKLGLNPTPPGRSALLDYTKRMTIEAGQRAKKLIKH